MQWTLTRYREATLTEYILASNGYKLNWENTTAWLAREIAYMVYITTPLEKGHRHVAKKDFMRLSIDKAPEPVNIEDTVKAAKDYELKLKKGLING